MIEMINLRTKPNLCINGEEYLIVCLTCTCFSNTCSEISAGSAVQRIMLDSVYIPIIH